MSRLLLTLLTAAGVAWFVTSDEMEVPKLDELAALAREAIEAARPAASTDTIEGNSRGREEPAGVEPTEPPPKARPREVPPPPRPPPPGIPAGEAVARGPALESTPTGVDPTPDGMDEAIDTQTDAPSEHLSQNDAQRIRSRLDRVMTIAGGARR